MNKRQYKKKKKKIDDRLDFIIPLMLFKGRQCGKTSLFNAMFEVGFNKGYRGFKDLKKMYKN